MPKKFPPEFKRDVVTVARRGDLTVAEVSADFDISPEPVRRWMRQADIDEGVRDGLTTAEQAEVVQLRRDKRRLEMENEILRRAAAYFARDSLPKMTFPWLGEAGRAVLGVPSSLPGWRELGNRSDGHPPLRFGARAIAKLFADVGHGGEGHNSERTINACPWRAPRSFLVHVPSGPSVLGNRVERRGPSSPYRAGASAAGGARPHDPSSETGEWTRPSANGIAAVPIWPSGRGPSVGRWPQTASRRD